MHDSASLAGGYSGTASVASGAVGDDALADDIRTREAKVEQIVAQDETALAAETNSLSQLLVQQKELLVAQQSLLSEEHQLDLQQADLAAKAQAVLPPPISALALAQKSVAAPAAAWNPADRYYPPYQPITPKPLEDVRSPTRLAIVHQPWNGRRLGDGPLSDSAMCLRVERMPTCPSGRNYTMTNKDGSYVYATNSKDDDAWSQQTIFYQAQTGMKLGVMYKQLLSLHRQYEVLAYEPVCPTQAPVDFEYDGTNPLYKFARMTKTILTFNAHWTVERYQCDGELVPQWEIHNRHSYNIFGILRSYDVFDYGTSDHLGPVGMLDSFYSSDMDLTVYYEAWVSRHVDLNWFSLVSTLLDINIGSDEVFSNWWHNVMHETSNSGTS